MQLKLGEPSHSVWLEPVDVPHFPRLTGNRQVDVLVVGGGITGITTALLLQRAGRSVMVVEARRIGGGVTGHTTAHLTAAVDTRYHALIKTHGRTHASVVAEANTAAIDWIARTHRLSHLNCAFQRVPGFLYAPKREHVALLEEEYEACRSVGLDVQLQTGASLPFTHHGALRFDGQAQFHPMDYLLPLADAIVEEGGEVYEDTRVIDVHDGTPCRVETGHGVITADDVIIAANAPLTRALLQTRVAHYRSYVLAYAYHGALPSGLYWDTLDPYHYVRLHRTRGTTFLVVGGEDHKTGQKHHTERCYERLHTWAQEHFSVGQPTHHWSAQVIEPVDGIPFIGRNPLSRHVFLATGYSGNGMTFGTAAAMVLSDLALGRRNAWADTFSPSRSTPPSSLKEYLKENVSFPVHFVRDRIKPADAHHLEQVARGEGKLVQCRAGKAAVYRDDAGVIHALSPVCTHLGCYVQFNNAERTWDCPCHGSRYDVDGQVINGPAQEPLRQRTEEELEPDVPLIPPKPVTS